jgi:endonuclease/exonuclease/phosphatase family metal-dependent hydrolase
MTSLQATGPSARAPSVITAVSYNIHRCIGVDGRYRPERIASVLEELDADVFGLQEVDTRLGAVMGPNELDVLVERLGFNVAVGPNLTAERGHLGNVLLSRWPIVTSRTLDLTVADREPRGAVDAEIFVAGRTLRLIVTHFGLRASERRRQATDILKAINEAPAEPLILMGDFNEWWGLGPLSRNLRKALGCAAPRSFPSRFPVLPLDRVCSRGLEPLERPRRHASRKARRASDHLPVRAVFALPRRDRGEWSLAGARDAIPL